MALHANFVVFSGSKDHNVEAGDVPVDVGSLKVFFDGGCPLCRREIQHYRNLDASVPIEWIDVTGPERPLEGYDLTLEEALRRFHVLDDHGQFHTGAHGFMILWDQLPYYRHLARLVRVLRLVPGAERVYVRFADWHYRRRCAQGLCVIPD